MMEKKRMAALLAAVLFGMSAIPAGAVNLIDTDTAATDSAEHAELDLYGVRATVTDRQDGELTVSTETAGTVVVHIQVIYYFDELPLYGTLSVPDVLQHLV